MALIIQDFAGANGLKGPLHLAIGMFDGVHLGHRAVIEAALQSARRCGGKAGVFTFNFHPSVLLRPENPTRLILPPDLRNRLLRQIGVDLIVGKNFSLEFSSVEAAEFLPMLKRTLPELAAVYVGEDFRFGKGRQGSVETLIQTGMACGVDTFSVRRIKHNGEDISSTRIRQSLCEGRIREVNRLLGYTYQTEGQVIEGRRIGRTIGFPTLNVAWAPELMPRFGSYAVTLLCPEKGATPLRGVANYGVRPTLESSGFPILETHLFESCPIETGDRIVVFWHAFIRAEMKFSNLEALRIQIERDKQQARLELERI